MTRDARTQAAPDFPRFRPVAEHAVLVELGESLERAVNDSVRRLDAALAQHPFEGFLEAVPAFASLLVEFDPVATDHARVQAALSTLLAAPAPALQEGATHEILVCYDEAFAPDLEEVAARSGLTREAVIAAHLSGDYSVFHFGFAPGYAYLGGVPGAIQLPRKPVARRGVAAGSILIAGSQCLVTTLTMPTGWWIIGRSPNRVLRLDDAARPFLFDVGDRVGFRRIDRATFEAEAGGASP